MNRTRPIATPIDAVRALFSEPGRRWERHDTLLAELGRRCGLARSEAERALDGLLADGSLDAITMFHAPALETRMAVESAYQPGPRLGYARGPGDVG